MSRKTIYIFCNEKHLHEEAGNLLSELRERIAEAEFFLINSEVNFVRRLKDRKSGIEILIMHKTNICSVVDFFVGLKKESRNKIGAVVLVRFDDSDEYLEELRLQAERLKKKGFLTLFSFKDTVAEVVDDFLKKNLSRED